MQIKIAMMNYLSNLSVLLVVFAVGLVPSLAQNPTAGQYLQVCVQQQNADMNSIMQFDTQGLIPGSLPAETLCVLKCIIEKYGIINSNGKFVEQNFLNSPYSANVVTEQQTVVKCMNEIPAVESCDHVQAFTKCYPKPVKFFTV